MASTYDVVINTPKHHRVGKLRLEPNKEKMVAHLDITDEGYADGEGLRNGEKEFALSGVAHVESGQEITFDVHGEMWANSINISGDSSIGEIVIYGTSTGISAGDYAGNDPMFAGRWADAQ